MTNPFEEFYHLYGNDPVRFAREVLGFEPDEAQQEVMREIVEKKGPGRGRWLSIRSGHGTGKTTTLSVIIVWHFCTRFPQITLATAPTSNQLFDALAAQTKAWFRKLPPAWLEHVVELKSESIHHKAAPEESFISFSTSRAETPEALAGKHSENILLIADEASGIPETVFVAAKGSMSGENATMIMAGNPVRTSGLFYDSHHTLAPYWTTFHWDCLKNPRVGRDFVEDAIRTYGEESNDFRVRVRGEFPTTEADAFIPYALIQDAIERDVQPTFVKPIWGVDPARLGGDRSTLAKRKGNFLLEPVREWKGLETMELVGRIKEQWDLTPPDDRPSMICVDAIGLGAGVADRLTELGLPCRAVNVSEAPTMVQGNLLNLKADLATKAREWFEGRACSLNGDRATAAELGWFKKEYTSSGKVKVEDNDKVRKRNRGKSPDRASAFLMTLAENAVGAIYGSQAQMNWKEPLQRNVTYV